MTALRKRALGIVVGVLKIIWASWGYVPTIDELRIWGIGKETHTLSVIGLKCGVEVNSVRKLAKVAV